MPSGYPLREIRCRSCGDIKAAPNQKCHCQGVTRVRKRNHGRTRGGTGPRFVLRRRTPAQLRAKLLGWRAGMEPIYSQCDESDDSSDDEPHDSPPRTCQPPIPTGRQPLQLMTNNAPVAAADDRFITVAYWWYHGRCGQQQPRASCPVDKPGRAAAPPSGPPVDLLPLDELEQQSLWFKVASTDWRRPLS